MNIEPVQNTDLLTLAEIEKELFEDDAFGVFLLHHYLQDNVFFDKIVNSDDEIVGFGIITKLNTDILNPHEFNFISGYLSHKIAHLVDFAIKKDYWSKGYGNNLLSHFINKINEQNYDYLYLEVNFANLRAIHFYERWKFQIIGKIQAYYNSGQDAQLMIKQLERF